MPPLGLSDFSIAAAVAVAVEPLLVAVKSSSAYAGGSIYEVLHYQVSYGVKTFISSNRRYKEGRGGMTEISLYIEK